MAITRELIRDHRAGRGTRAAAALKQGRRINGPEITRDPSNLFELSSGVCSSSILFARDTNGEYTAACMRHAAIIVNIGLGDARDRNPSKAAQRSRIERQL